MAREMQNMVMLAGPMSSLNVKDGKDRYGGMGISFLVNAGGPVAMKVSSKVKFDWMIDQARRAKSVVITNGFMNGWMAQPREGDASNQPKLMTNLGARASGMFFLDSMVDPHAGAMVEGTITTVQGEWVTLVSSYTVPKDEQNREHTRIVITRWPYTVDQRAVGNLGFVIGIPTPKWNDQWYLHLEVRKGWILWGKK
jgi:hypothetical protein